jgi:hypothetical protein
MINLGRAHEPTARHRLRQWRGPRMAHSGKMTRRRSRFHPRHKWRSKSIDAKISGNNYYSRAVLLIKSSFTERTRVSSGRARRTPRTLDAAVLRSPDGGAFSAHVAGWSPVTSQPAPGGCGALSPRNATGMCESRPWLEHGSVLALPKRGKSQSMPPRAGRAGVHSTKFTFRCSSAVAQEIRALVPSRAAVSFCGWEKRRPRAQDASSSAPVPPGGA